MDLHRCGAESLPAFESDFCCKKNAFCAFQHGSAVQFDSSGHVMSDFLAGALSAAITDLEAKRSTGESHGSAKRIKVGRVEKKDKAWLTNRGAKNRALKDIPSTSGLSEFDLERSRKALERKEREYKRMYSKGTDMALTGDAADNLLVNFDRKWAEGHRQGSSDEDEPNDEEDPFIEIQDEFGRTRQVRKSEALRHERPVIENERPATLIHGPHLQRFNPDAAKKDAIWAEEKAGQEVHYDPTFDLRQRGTGYINLGRGDERTERLNNLEGSRRETLKNRREDVAAEREVRDTTEPQDFREFVHPSRKHHIGADAISSIDEKRAKAGADFLDTIF